MKFFGKYTLLFVVFVTGAAILIIEVVAVRILSPYYGNTIFTVSSVIGVVLAALSLGYYLGGRFADRYPLLKWFYSIILIGGLSVLFLQLLNLFFLPVIGYFLSIISGPFVSAMALFFIPSFLLGTLSPFAIKLQKLHFPNEGIGRITGGVFFWSTTGSIFGSFFAGFVLIPRFGVNQIIMATGILLTLIGLLPLMGLDLQRKNIIKVILITIIGTGMVIFFSFYFKHQSKEGLIYSHHGLYEKITIYDDEYDGRPARILRQDRTNSGAMFLDSDELAYDYTKYYILYKIFKPEVKEALAIGGGAYSVPKALLSELPNANIDVSEIEPSLFEIGKKYFRVPDDQRLKNYVQDGRRFLHDSEKKYDLIFSDVYYSLWSIPAHFTTEEFFQIAQNKLRPEGILIINLVGNLSSQFPSFIFSEIKTFKSIFPNSYFFAVKSPQSMDLQNIIFVGYNSNKEIDFNKPEIKESENQIIRKLSEKVINLDKFDLSPYPKLTDNFSPVEYLIAKLLKRHLAWTER